MNDKSCNIHYHTYLTILIVVIGSTIAYGTSNIAPDDLHALWVFILINCVSIMSLYFGGTFLKLNSESISTVTKIVLTSLLLIVPILFLDMSALILIPTMNVSGLPIRTMSMGIVGVILLITILLYPQLRTSANGD